MADEPAREKPRRLVPTIKRLWPYHSANLAETVFSETKMAKQSLILATIAIVLVGSILGLTLGGSSGGPELNPDTSTLPQPELQATPGTAEISAPRGSSDDPADTAESNPSRVAIPTDPRKTGPTLLVVERGSDRPVPFAEVFAADRIPSNRKSWHPHWAEGLLKSAKPIRADAQGKVLLTRIERRIYIAARGEGLFGAGEFDRRNGKDITLALDPDQAVEVRVIDSEGEGCPGIPVALCVDVDRWLIQRKTATTDSGGYATLSHLQIHRWKIKPPKKGTQKGSPPPAAVPERDADFTIIAKKPQFQPAVARLSPTSLPAEPVILRLAATGSLIVKLLGPDRLALKSPCKVALTTNAATLPPPTIRPEQAGSLRLVCAESIDKPLGADRVRFEAIGSATTLDVHIQFPDDDFNFKQEGIPGPSPNGETLVEISVPAWFTSLTGKVIDEQGQPLASQSLSLMFTGGSGRIEGERIRSTPEGHFELPIKFPRPVPDEFTPPFSLEFRVLRGEERLGYMAPIPELLTGHNHDLGTIKLEPMPVLAQGVVRDDRGRPIRRASVTLQAFRNQASTSGAWRSEDYISTRTDNEGRYRLEGGPRAMALRLRARAHGHVSVESPQITMGAQQDFVLPRLGTLEGNGVAPEWVPREALEIEIFADNKELRDEKLRLRSQGRFDFRIDGLKPGRYDVAFTMRGIPRPLITIHGVEVAPGKGAPDPRLTNLDFRPSLFRFIVQAVDQAGKPINKANSPLLALLTGRDGQARHVAFPWRNSKIEFIATEPSVAVVMLASGHRPTSTIIHAGTNQLAMHRLNPVKLVLSGLRQLIGAERRVRISMVYEGDTGLPMKNLRSIDQTSGKSRTFQRASMGKSSGAWLGESDTVRVPLMVNGRYQVYVRLYERGLRSPPWVVIGSADVVLDQPKEQTVTLVPAVEIIRKLLADLEAQKLREAQRPPNSERRGRGR